jgi:hypothetical protein
VRRSERVWRGLLALTIAGTIPLSMWGSGCSSQPLVQPDAGQTGGSPGTGGLLGSGGRSSGGSNGTGGSQLQDASVDDLSPCCLAAQSLTAQCTPDGKQLRQCLYTSIYPQSRECSAGTSDYAYVWEVQTCPNGCVTVDAGLAGAGGATQVAGAKCQTSDPTGTGGAYGGSGGAGGQSMRDASSDAASSCCSQSESGANECSPDGHQLRRCLFELALGTIAAQCANLPYAYGYVWEVQSCPNGCLMVDAGGTGAGGAVGIGAICQ